MRNFEKAANSGYPLQIAWDYLRFKGELSNKFLLANDGLNVKRSSAVCAILARLPGVSQKPPSAP